MFAMTLAALSALTIAPPSPTHNLAPQPNFYQTCYSHGNASTACQVSAATALDYARKTEGLGPLILPKNWQSLTPGDQLFVLTNLERVARGETAIQGRVASLNQAALVGAQGQKDPYVQASQSLPAWGSNWADDTNPLGSFYAWMYDDGWGGPGLQNTSNLACTSATSSGCWGHRRNILMHWMHLPWTTGTVYLGEGTAQVPATAPYAMYLSDTMVTAVTTTPPSYTFTWAQALQAGANNPATGWNPLVAPLGPLSLSVNTTAPVATKPVSLTVQHVPVGASVTAWIQSPRTGQWHGISAPGSTVQFVPQVPGVWPVNVYVATAQDPHPTPLTTTVTVAPDGSQITGLSLTGLPSHVIAPGTSVTLAPTGHASQASGLQYQFWVRGTTGGWRMVQNYGQSSHYTLAALAPGSYAVAVYGLDAAQVHGGAWRQAFYRTGVINVGSSVSIATPTVTAASVSLTATATGLTTPVYQWWVKSPSGTWTSSGAYSSQATWTFTPPQAGSYTVKVFAKDPEAPSTAAESVTATTTVTVP